MSELRQRSTKKEEEEAKSSPSLSPAARARAEDNAITLLDLCRGLVFLLLLCGATSYIVTRESFIWNIKRPGWTRPAAIRAWINGPQLYTDADLKAYDGTDPTKPILLAINGTVYDVTLGSRHYGPGGSYHFFAGADASRGFVSGCFKEDITPDLRGLEQMFLPLDDPEIDSLYTPRELKILREQEKRKAREEVHKALKGWVDFFEKSSKYPKVGRVKREPGWEEKNPVPKLCEAAQARRKRRDPPKAKEEKKGE